MLQFNLRYNDSLGDLIWKFWDSIETVIKLQQIAYLLTSRLKTQSWMFIICMQYNAELQ